MKNSRAALVISVLSLLFLVSCQHQAPSDHGEKPSQPHSSPIALKHRRAIVFVHGIHGSSDDTWKVPPSGPDWPDLMKSDSKFADAEIFRIGLSDTLHGQ